MSASAPADTRMLNNLAAPKAGILLVVATLLEIAAMAHHPSVHTQDIAQAIEAILRLASLSAWVHGVLIALMLGIFYVLAEFSRRRGIERPWVRAGLIAYAIGVLSMIGAASMSGFVIGHVAAAAPHVADADLRTTAQLLNFCSVLNQTFANLGAILMSLGIVFWSVDLLRTRPLPRLLGLFGLLVGIVPAVALIFGGLHLNVIGMTQVVVLQALWNVGIGVLLVRGAV
jgi:hypothetical protein